MSTNTQLEFKHIFLFLTLSALLPVFAEQACAQWPGQGRAGGFRPQPAAPQFRQFQPSSSGTSSRPAWSQGQTGRIKQMDMSSFSSGHSKQRFQGARQNWSTESGSRPRYKNLEAGSGSSVQRRRKFNVEGQGMVSKGGQKSYSYGKGSKSFTSSKSRAPKTSQSLDQFGTKGKSVGKSSTHFNKAGASSGGTRPGSLKKSSVKSFPSTGKSSGSSSIVQGFGKIKQPSSGKGLATAGSGKRDFGKVPGSSQASADSLVPKGFGKTQPGATDSKAGKPGIAKGDFGSSPIVSNRPSSPDWKKTMMEANMPGKSTGVGGHTNPLKSSVVKGGGKIQQASQGGNARSPKVTVDSNRNPAGSVKGSSTFGGANSGTKKIVTSKKVDSQAGKTTSIQTKEILDKTTGNKKVLAQEKLEYAKDPKTGKDQFTGAEITKTVKDKRGNIVQENTFIRRNSATQDLTKNKILTDKSGKITEMTETKVHRDPKTGKVTQTQTVKNATGKIIAQTEKVVVKNPTTGGKTITKTESKLDPKTNKMSSVVAKAEIDTKGNIKSTTVASDKNSLEKSNGLRLFDQNFTGNSNPTQDTLKAMEQMNLKGQDIAAVQTVVHNDGTIQQIAQMKDGSVLQGLFDQGGQLLPDPNNPGQPLLTKVDASNVLGQAPIAGAGAPGDLAGLINQLGQGQVAPDSILQSVGQAIQSVSGQGMSGAYDPTQMDSMYGGGASPGSTDVSYGDDSSGWASAASEGDYLPDDSSVVTEDDEPYYSQSRPSRSVAAARQPSVPRAAKASEGYRQEESSTQTLQAQEDPECGTRIEEAINAALGKAIQEYAIQDIIEATDIERARSFMPKYLVWKYGSMPQACAALQDAGALTSQAAAFLLELGQIENNEIPTLHVPGVLLDAHKPAQVSDKAMTSHAIIRVLGLPAEAANPVVEYLEREPTDSSEGLSLLVLPARDYVVDDRLIRELVEAIRKSRQQTAQAAD